MVLSGLLDLARTCLNTEPDQVTAARQPCLLEVAWCLLDGLDLCWIHVPDKIYLWLSELQLIGIELKATLLTKLQECCQVLVVILVCLFHRASITHYHEIISYYFDIRHPFYQPVHPSLEHFGSRSDTKRHSLPAVPAEWGVECGEE